MSFADSGGWFIRWRGRKITGKGLFWKKSKQAFLFFAVFRRDL